MKTKEYVKGLISGDISTLAKSITLIESQLKTDQEKAIELIDKCIPLSGNSIRIGISGTPGAGKSTFINALGKLLLHKHKIAVLTIDPSSTISKGSILGDKTRMPHLSNSKSVFIRPSPSSGELGGITKNTKNSILLCETAGFNIIIIETVGVGQSETFINNVTDISLYLTLVNNGDELQFIKKGALELSNIIIVNKSDQNQEKAEQLKHILENSLTNNNLKNSQTVFTCSALYNTHIHKIWDHIKTRIIQKKEENNLIANRNKQDTFWIKKTIEDELKELIINNKSLQDKISKLNTTQKKNPQKIAKEIINNLIKEDLK